MDITPLIAPILNVSTLPIGLRRELDSKNLDLKNAFSLGEVIGNMDKVLYFSFLISGLSASQFLEMVEPTALMFQTVHYHPPTNETVARYDVLVSGSVAEFQGFNSDITNFIKNYRRGLYGNQS